MSLRRVLVYKHHHYVRDGGHWKIDDIRGTIDGKPWSMRNMLAESLKN